jgi:hypothetical protein
MFFNTYSILDALHLACSTIDLRDMLETVCAQGVISEWKFRDIFVYEQSLSKSFCPCRTYFIVVEPERVYLTQVVGGTALTEG